jgi:D-alanine-D-alanine ligase
LKIKKGELMSTVSLMQAGRAGKAFPIHKIAVVYCTSSGYAPGRDDERKADCEVVEVAQAIKSSLDPNGYAVELVNLDAAHIAELARYDWVFNLVEMVNGFPLTDYEVAEQFENMNIYFTGSGSTALKNCLDKATTKCELLRHGIPTPSYTVFPPGSRVFSLLPYPVIVKPVHEDGSIGITRNSVVRTAVELERQVQHIHVRYQQAALVEEYIDGRDITASVIGNGREAEVLPLSEITYVGQDGADFLTFDAKWECETLEYQQSVARCPCPMSPEMEQLIKAIALQACQVMGCRDYSRVDFRLRGDQPFVLEVNPNPCINPVDAGFVRCCNAGGYAYAQMANRILTDSIRNHVQEPARILDKVY